MDRVWLQEMSWAQVQEVLKRTNIILLPIGATEQHGPHLPLGVDTYIPMYAAEEIARRSGVPAAPPIWFSPCEWHMGFPGTISISPKTMMELVADVSRSLRRHGFRHFIALKGHTSGNNPVLLSAADAIQLELPDVRLWVVDLVLMTREATLRACASGTLYHADEVETSQMLVARQDLVHLEKAKAVIPPAWSHLVRLDYRSVDD